MIDTIFFWLDGVVTAPLAETAISQLEAATEAALDIQSRTAIRDWALELQLGHMDGLTFSQKALGLTCASLEDKELAARIQSSVVPIPGVLEIIKELAEKYEVWLIANYHEDWLLPIAHRLDLDLFGEDSILVCPKLGLARLFPEIFYVAAHRARRPIEACLLVSAQSATTTAAMRIGLNAIIFADAGRLRRELCLRKLLPSLEPQRSPDNPH